MEMTKSTVSLTRPADTTPYATGDVITAPTTPTTFKFENLPPFVETGALLESAVVISSANVATKPELELWLFDADILDLDADNAPWTPTDAQMLTLVGIVGFASTSFKVGDGTSGAGGNSACEQKNLGLACKSNSLYGVLVIRNAYVPVSGEIFTIRLTLIK